MLRALRAVAEKGRLTVVCVIHQPRYEIFGKDIDDLHQEMDASQEEGLMFQ